MFSSLIFRSSAQHPYVKAAIISTIIDLPCGCSPDVMSGYKEFESATEQTRADDDNETEDGSTMSSTFESSTALESTSLTSVPVIDIDTDEIENIEDMLDNSNALSQSREDLSDVELPIRIIIPSVHIHFDEESQNYWKYEQFVLKTGSQSFHEHLQGGEKLLEIKEAGASLKNVTTVDAKIFVGNRSLNDIKQLAKAEKIFVDRSGKSYAIGKALVSIANVYEIIPVEFDIVKDSPTHQMFGVRHHYEQLNRWLQFKI